MIIGSKKGYTPPQWQGGAFNIIIAIFGVMILLLIFMPSAERDELLGNVTPEYTSTVFSINPGQIEGAGEAETIKKIYLPDIIVDNSAKLNIEEIASQLEIKKSLFSTHTASSNFAIDFSKLNNARLQFKVTDRDGDGSLNVKLNGRTVFSRGVGLGESIDVPLPELQLKEINTIRISVSSPGFAIWETNSYTLSDVKLAKSEYDGGAEQQTFTLTESELDNTRSAKLTAFVKTLGTSANLELALNGNIFYNALPKESLSLSIPADSLRENNRLEWSSSKEGFYELKYITLKVNTLSIGDADKLYYFDIKDSDWSKIESGKYDCDLRIVKNSGDELITIQINDMIREFDFEGMEIREGICSHLKEDENKLALFVDDKINIGEVSIKLGK